MSGAPRFEVLALVLIEMVVGFSVGAVSAAGTETSVNGLRQGTGAGVSNQGPRFETAAEPLADAGVCPRPIGMRTVLTKL